MKKIIPNVHNTNSVVVHLEPKAAVKGLDSITAVGIILEEEVRIGLSFHSSNDQRNRKYGNMIAFERAIARPLEVIEKDEFLGEYSSEGNGKKICRKDVIAYINSDDIYNEIMDAYLEVRKGRPYADREDEDAIKDARAELKETAYSFTDQQTIKDLEVLRDQLSESIEAKLADDTEADFKPAIMEILSKRFM